MAAKPQIISLHRFTDDQALAWLASKSPVAVPCTMLAKQWGWHRNTVGAKLKSWAAAGKIERKGKVIKVQKIVQNSAQQSAQGKVANKLLASLMIFIALCMGVTLVWVNLTAWSAMTNDAHDAVKLQVLAVVFDLLAIILPGAAKLAPMRAAIPMLVMWVAVVLVILWTAIGFANGTFGDVVGTREATMDRRTIVQERLGALRKELAALPPFAPTSDAQATAATEERRRECDQGRYCTRSRSKEALVLAARDLTVRADKLGADIEKYEAELKTLPVIASADPQITGGVRAVKLMGYQLDQADASVWRDIIFALVLVLFPGGLIRGGISLLRP